MSKLLESLEKLRTNKKLSLRQFSEEYLGVNYTVYTRALQYEKMPDSWEEHWELFTTKVIPDLLKMNVHVCCVPHEGRSVLKQVVQSRMEKADTKERRERVSNDIRAELNDALEKYGITAITGGDREETTGSRPAPKGHSRKGGGR